MAALVACIANVRFGPPKIGNRLSPLDKHLGHANSEFHNYHQAQLPLICYSERRKEYHRYEECIKPYCRSCVTMSFESQAIRSIIG